MEKIIVSLNNVYHADAVHYWCNALGEINMPGEASYRPHTPEELPPVYRELYDKYQYETDSVHTYVVSYDGVPGMMLTALHDNGYYDDVADITKNHTALYKQLHDAAMSAALYLIYARAEKMLEDEMFSGCTVLIGDFTDPDGHELCLFVPPERCKQLDEIRNHFIQQYCWVKADEKKIRAMADLLSTPDDGAEQQQ